MMTKAIVTQADREASANFLCPSAGGWLAAHAKQHADDNQTMVDLAEAFALRRAADGRSIAAALEPVRHWYESADHEPRDTVDILKVVVTDLQSDRRDVLAMRAALLKAEEVFELVEHPKEAFTPHVLEVAALGDRIGYGALMSTASALWRRRLAAGDFGPGGEFVAGPCQATIDRMLTSIRAILAGYEVSA